MFNVKWFADISRNIQHSTLNIQHSTFARRGEPLAIVALWASAIAFTNPRGNFPIDDDWDFALAAWRFAETGHFHFTAFTAVSLRAQVLWGALWTRVFGESFDVLRLSTMVLAAMTLVIVHRVLLRAGVPRFARIIATLALGFHPIFFWSSCTFMTEVPFVFASAVALACFVRAFDDDHVGWLLAGCVAALTACFVRQTGITLLAAPMILALLRRRYWHAVVVGSSIATFGAIFLLKPEWLTGSMAEFAVHFKMWTEATFRLPEQVAVFDHYATFNAQNCALFFLPLVAPLAIVFARKPKPFDLGLAGALTIVLLARVQSLLSLGISMPYFVSPYCCDVFAGNIFTDFGLGPLALEGNYPFRLPHAARLGITYASVLLAALVLWAVLRRASTTNLSLLALGSALFGSLALFGSGLYVDLYSLDSAWPLVLALPLMIPWQSRVVRGISIAALILIATFSTLSVQEYFSWNRARWTAINDLRARGIAVTQINAGAEPFYLYELSHGDQRMRRIHQFGVGDRPYTLAYEPVAGKRVIATYPYSGWFGWHKADVLVLSGTSYSAARAPAHPPASASAPALRAAFRRAMRSLPSPDRASPSSVLR